jgi:hypothetical protein
VQHSEGNTDYANDRGAVLTMAGTDEIEIEEIMSGTF